MYSSLTETEQMLLVEARFLGNSLAFFMKVPCLYICIQVTVAKMENVALFISCLFKAVFYSSAFLCIDGCSPMSFYLCDFTCTL